MLNGAHGFIVNNPQFVNNTNVEPQHGSGIRELLSNSMPDAFRDSSARYPPPKCHLSTRKDYISKIVSWAQGASDHTEPILWMYGPFGVGKSAIAQSCADVLHVEKKLAATLFFSRSNDDRHDPGRVFTSIAYQIATKFASFSRIIDLQIQNDPTLPTKSLPTQFDELIVAPLGKVAEKGLDGLIVVLDGLDECRGTRAQCTIIDTITKSAREKSTPFRWFITSRPEPHIARSMKSKAVSSSLFPLELPVSRDTDHQILMVLTDELTQTRETHGLPTSWPSEDDLALLVEVIAGLFIYATTIIRFVQDPNSSGPKTQLATVIAFAQSRAIAGTKDPLVEMDFFYALIMQQLPPSVSLTIRKFLLVRKKLRFSPHGVSARFYREGEPWAGEVIDLLGLSTEEFKSTCSALQSVLEFRDFQLHFYHASFMDFMTNPERSKEFCIYGDCVNKLHQQLIARLNGIHSRGTDNFDGTSSLPNAGPFRGGETGYLYYQLVYWIFQLCSLSGLPLDSSTATCLAGIRFSIIKHFLVICTDIKVEFDPNGLARNVRFLSILSMHPLTVTLLTASLIP